MRLIYEKLVLTGMNRVHEQIIRLFGLVLRTWCCLFDFRQLSFGVSIFIDTVFSGMHLFLWGCFISFVPLMNLLDRLLWNPYSAVILFMRGRDVVFGRSSRSRNRRFFPITLATLLQGTISFLHFDHLCLVFDSFELVDLLNMLLGISLVTYLIISSSFVLLIIIKLLFYRPPELDFLVEVVLNITIILLHLSHHWTSLEANYFFVLL